MSQVDHIADLHNQIAEELFWAIHNLEKAESKFWLPPTRQTLTECHTAVNAALIGLQRAQRLSGPFEPAMLPQEVVEDMQALDLENEGYDRTDEREYSRIHTQ